MKTLIEIVCTKILKKEIKLSDAIPGTYLFQLLIARIVMCFRGYLKTIGCKKSGIIFVGDKVRIKCKKNITFGTGVTIKDRVTIDALSYDGIIIGDNVSIGEGSYLMCSGSLSKIGKGIVLGDRVGIGNDCFFGAAGGVYVGSDVLIGQNVRFHSENHEFRDVTKKISEQGVSNKGITVGDNCWIGAGAVFLDGVNIGNGCVVGANTLVNRDIPNNAIAVGNPARIIGFRGE